MTSSSSPLPPNIFDEEVPLTPFPCDFTYHLYYKTGTDNKPKWKPSSSKKKILITIDPNSMDLIRFREALQAACNKSTVKLGDMVMADLMPNILGIDLSCWISKLEGYMKNCGRLITDEESYLAWVNKASKLQSNNRRAGCEWSMDKPVDEDEKAKEAAGVAKTLRSLPKPMINGVLPRRTMEDIEDTDEYDRVGQRILSQGVKDFSIDRHTDVFRMPDDLDRYVLMSPDNILRWTHEAIDPGKPAITEASPPIDMRKHIRDLPAQKRQRINLLGQPASSSYPPVNQLVPAAPRPMRPSLGMAEYLQFCKIPDAEGVAKVFAENYLFDYQSLAGDAFKEEHIKEMGFRGGMWVNLCSNIKPYEESLVIPSGSD